MTILGSFNYTNANLDPEYFFWKCDTILFADGRISNRVSDGTDQVVIDTAPKLAVLEIRVRSESGEMFSSEFAIGYAGASALIALSVLTFAGQVLKNLKGEALPNIDQIAGFIGEAFKASLHEYSQNIIKPLNMAAVLCMFDVSARQTVRRQVGIVCVNGAYNVNISEPVTALSIVSGPDTTSLETAIHSAFRDKRHQVDAENEVVREVELNARAHSDGKPFGGQLQVCRVGDFGVQLAATQFWDYSHRGSDLPDSWAHGDYRTLLLGYDVFDLRIGQCDFIVDEIVALPESDRTPWAKATLPSEPRQGDDGDLFSQPRRGVI